MKLEKPQVSRPTRSGPALPEIKPRRIADKLILPIKPNTRSNPPKKHGGTPLAHTNHTPLLRLASAHNPERKAASRLRRTRSSSLLRHSRRKPGRTLGTGPANPGPGLRPHSRPKRGAGER